MYSTSAPSPLRPSTGLSSSTCSTPSVKRAATFFPSSLPIGSPFYRSLVGYRTNRPLNALKCLLGGTLTRLHRAVHVAVPDGGGLGAGPVDRPDRRSQRVSEARPGAGRHVAAVAAAGPLLLGPAALDEVGGFRRLR